MKRKRQPAKFDRCIKAVKKRGGAASPYAVCKASVKNRGKKKNPADLADQAFEQFTGRKATGVIKVQEKRHEHKHLFEVGTLRKLVVISKDGKYRVTLNRFKGATLAANEGAILEALQKDRKITQLFIKNGDQWVDVKQFGLDPRNLHELETLGTATVIDYHQIKDHLGDEGGDAIYRHKFRQTRIGDKHVTLKVAKYPDVIYRVLDERLEFSGGSYEIRAEGIDL